MYSQLLCVTDLSQLKEDHLARGRGPAWAQAGSAPSSADVKARGWRQGLCKEPGLQCPWQYPMGWGVWLQVWVGFIQRQVQGHSKSPGGAQVFSPP